LPGSRLPLRALLRAALALLLGVVAAGPVLAARLTGLAAAPGSVSIAADGPPAVAQQMALAGPYRLVVDVPGVINGQLTAPGAASVARLRAAMFSPGIARVVIDLSAPLEIVTARSSSTGLTLTLRRVSEAEFAAQIARGRRPLPVAGGGPEIVLPATTPASSAPPGANFDLPSGMFGSPESPAAAPAKPPETPAPDVASPPVSPPQAVAAPPETVASPPADPPKAAARPAKTVQKGVKSRSGTKPVVVIDAGHGGKDVGAIAVDGRYEKDVTLAVARLTARNLEKSGKVRVVLTRNDDRFIPLGGRVTIARNARADLFISIHADAAANPLAHGASVYTLSAVASDAVAARLAARENKADIIGGVNLGVEAPEVGEIMIDLSRRATTNVSVAFAETLQDELSSRIGFRGEFHHFAGFRVLKAPDVPSVLLETGYVSNAEDAEMLFSADGRRRIAAGIARAAERHLVGD
jgi:N-acetylmuramoyl-L-alanine amidase